MFNRENVSTVNPDASTALCDSIVSKYRVHNSSSDLVSNAPSVKVSNPMCDADLIQESSQDMNV